MKLLRHFRTTSTPVSGASELAPSPALQPVTSSARHMGGGLAAKVRRHLGRSDQSAQGLENRQAEAFPSAGSRTCGEAPVTAPRSPLPRAASDNPSAGVPVVPSATSRRVAPQGDARSTALGTESLLKSARTLVQSTRVATAPLVPVAELGPATEDRPVAPKKPGKFKRLVGALNRGPIELTGPLPGMTLARDMPVRSKLPEKTKPPNSVEADEVLRACEKLTREARELHLQATQQPGPSVWDRPAQSKINRAITHVAPWFKPKKLSQIATLGEKPSQTEVESQFKQATTSGAESVNLLLGVVNQRERASKLASYDLAKSQRAHQKASRDRDVANIELDARRGELDEAEATASPSDVSTLRQRVDDATRRLEDAHVKLRKAGRALKRASDRFDEMQAALRQAASGVDLHGVGERMSSAEATAQQAEFLVRQVSTLKDKIFELQAETVEQINSLDRAIQSHIDLKRDKDLLEAEILAECKQANCLLHEITRQWHLVQQLPYSSPVRLPAVGQLLEKRVVALQALHDSTARLAWLNEAPSLKASNAEHARALAARAVATKRFAASTEAMKLAGEAAQNFSEKAAVAAAEKSDAQIAFRRVTVRYGEVLASLPPGFEHGDLTQAFGSRLWRAAQKGRASNPSAGAFPELMLFEIASNAFSLATNGDPQRAMDLLKAVSERASIEWSEIASDSGQSLPGDVATLFRLMSDVPRGMEVLALLGNNPSGVPTADELDTLRVYWSVDKACSNQAALPPATRDWLKSAQRVARAKLSGGSLEPLDDVDQGAYKAVALGYLSNAPGSEYDLHDQQMRKQQTWVDREAKDSDGSWTSRLTPNKETLKSIVMPHRFKSPYRPRALKQIVAMAERFGADTNRSIADTAIKDRIKALAEISDSSLHTDFGVDAAARLFDVTVQETMAHLTKFEHPSQATLGPKDFRTIRTAVRRRLMEPLPLEARNRLRKPPPEPTVLPPLFEEMAQQHPTPLEVVFAVGDFLKLQGAERLPEAKLQQLTNDPAVQEADEAARMKRFASLDDMLRFYKPMILSMQLRHKFKVWEGGAFGASIPFLPYSWISPIVSPIFAANVWRRDEAFMQLFMPIIGPEISFGSSKAYASDVTVGVGIGPAFDVGQGGAVAGSHPGVETGLAAPGLALQTSLTATLGAQSNATQSTVVRFFRRRGEDEQLRAKTLNALDSIARWDRIQPNQGRAYAGPMEAVLSRNPDVSVSRSHAQANKFTIGTRLGADVKFKSQALGGKSYAVYSSVGLTGQSERIDEGRNETNGYISIRNEKAQTQQQKIFSGIRINGFTPVNNTPHFAGGAPWRLQAERRLFWHMEKNSVSPFNLHGKQDADLDRHSAKPQDMLSEIQLNRPLWLARCLEVIDPESASRPDTPESRKVAAEKLEAAADLLHALEDEIEESGRRSDYSQYNINYSMKPNAGAWIDSFRALEALARQRNDDDTAQRYQLAADRVLGFESTWRALMLIVREKGKQSVSLGINYGARLQRVHGAEGQRTAVQFPPP